MKEASKAFPMMGKDLYAVSWLTSDTSPCR